MKNTLFFFLATGIILFYACSPSPSGGQTVYSSVTGETMGTYYKITYSDTIRIQEGVDSLLKAINQAVSTYIPDSDISQFNRSDSGMIFQEGHFTRNFRIASQFFEMSGGLYDPSVMPLVNYWGFGTTGKHPEMDIDSLSVDSLLQIVGLKKIIREESEGRLKLIKSNPGNELDFSSVAKGYAVDRIALRLDSLGIAHYLIDIGGEMVLKGLNPKGQAWSIGINTPEEGAGLTESVRYISLSGKALATSGNYRNFYTRDGKKLSHTIHPITGYPERNELLSATVIAPDCASADAWATTCMVSGLQRSREYLRQYPDVSACLIYVSADTMAFEYQNGFESYLIP